MFYTRREYHKYKLWSRRKFIVVEVSSEDNFINKDIIENFAKFLYFYLKLTIILMTVVTIIHSGLK